MRPLPKTNAEQRTPFYDDVEDLTSVGFLSHTIDIAGTHISLRSLCSGDLFFLRSNSTLDWQSWMIAYSVWMINGYNLLEESNSAYHIQKIIRRMPEAIQVILFSIVTGLFNRQGKAVGAVESYCYENASRFRWKASTNTSIGSISESYRTIGTNPVMQMWRFFNEIEDKRIFDEAQWDGFKLAASASSPKGVDKIDKHDRNRREQEMNRRQDVQDRFFYTQKGIVSPDLKRTDIESMALRSKSVEDLESEMKRWVTGEEDWHDKIVTKYKTDITNRYDLERKEREERRRLLQKKYEEMELNTKPQPLVAYTSDQLNEMLKGRRPGVSRIFEDMNGTQEKMYQRHLHAADKGLLVAEDDRLAAPNTDPKLMDLISKRNVPFKVEG